MADKEITIVTGSNKGIGKGIALKLAEEGHNIMLFGRDADALKKAEKEVKDKGAETIVFTGDVADTDFVNKAVKQIEEKYGKVDHLINNAGMGIFKNLIDADLDDFKKQVDANLYGIFNFSKAVLPGMIKKQTGSIINIVSLAGKNSFTGGTMYSATKHAALGLTRSLMLEVRQYNIRVAAICPGSVDTDFNFGSSMKPNRDKVLQVEDVADSVLAILKLPARALISEIDLRPTNPK
ncbi:MAG: SDR family NAD(P)-dependent oxidoreductase [Ignavibacteriaceae bacterium]